MKRNFASKRKPIVQLEDEQIQVTNYGFGFRPNDTNAIELKPEVTKSIGALSGLICNYEQDSEDEDEEEIPITSVKNKPMIKSILKTSKKTLNDAKKMKMLNFIPAIEKVIAFKPSSPLTIIETKEDKNLPNKSQSIELINDKSKDEVDIKLMDFLAEIESLEKDNFNPDVNSDTNPIIYESNEIESKDLHILKDNNLIELVQDNSTILLTNEIDIENVLLSNDEIINKIDNLTEENCTNDSLNTEMESVPIKNDILMDINTKNDVELSNMNLDLEYKKIDETVCQNLIKINTSEMLKIGFEEKDNNLDDIDDTLQQLEMEFSKNVTYSEEAHYINSKVDKTHQIISVNNVTDDSSIDKSCLKKIEIAKDPSIENQNIETNLIRKSSIDNKKLDLNKKEKDLKIKNDSENELEKKAKRGSELENRHIPEKKKHCHEDKKSIVDDEINFELKAEKRPIEPIAPYYAWQNCFDDASQCYYYWNVETNDVTWEMPAGFSKFAVEYKTYEENMQKYQKLMLEWLQRDDKRKDIMLKKKQLKLKKKKSALTSLVQYSSDDEVTAELNRKNKKEKKLESEDKDDSEINKTRENLTPLVSTCEYLPPSNNQDTESFNVPNISKEQTFINKINNEIENNNDGNDVHYNYKMIPELIDNQFIINHDELFLDKKNNVKIEKCKTNNNINKKRTKRLKKFRKHKKSETLPEKKDRSDGEYSTTESDFNVNSDHLSSLDSEKEMKKELLNKINEKYSSKDTNIKFNEKFSNDNNLKKKKAIGSNDISLNDEFELSEIGQQVKKRKLKHHKSENKKVKKDFSINKNDSESHIKQNIIEIKMPSKSAFELFNIDSQDIFNKSNQLNTIVDQSEELSDQLGYLQVNLKNISKFQEILIQAQTRLSDWKEGELSTHYLLSKITQSKSELLNFLQDSLSIEWKCQWDRNQKCFYYSNQLSGEVSWIFPGVTNYPRNDTFQNQDSALYMCASEEFDARESVYFNSDYENLHLGTNLSQITYLDASLPPPPPPMSPRPHSSNHKKDENFESNYKKTPTMEMDMLSENSFTISNTYIITNPKNSIITSEKSYVLPSFSNHINVSNDSKIECINENKINFETLKNYNIEHAELNETMSYVEDNISNRDLQKSNVISSNPVLRVKGQEKDNISKNKEPIITETNLGDSITINNALLELNSLNGKVEDCQKSFTNAHIVLTSNIKKIKKKEKAPIGTKHQKSFNSLVEKWTKVQEDVNREVEKEKVKQRRLQELVAVAIAESTQNKHK